MRKLKELALMVEPLELHDLVNNINNLRNDSMIGKLYTGIIEGEFNSDENAFASLYPNSHSTDSYRKLKSSVKGKLKNFVLLFDEKKRTESPYQRAYYQCYKDWATVKILLGQNAREIAIDIAEGVLAKAIKFEFSDLVMDIASVLRLHYGARLGDKEKFNHHNQVFKQYQEVYNLEEVARELYIDLMMNYVNDRSSNKNKHEIAAKALETLEKNPSNCKTRRYLLCYYIIKVIFYISSYKYNNAIVVCREAIHFFEKKGGDTQLPSQIFYYNQLICHIQLGQFEAGKQVSETCLKLIKTGTFNWFKFYELYIILAFHTGKYEEALKIFQTVTNHQRFLLLPENIIEIWKVFQAYLHYLFYLRVTRNAPENLTGHKTFNIARVVSEIEVLSKDKAGTNPAILVIQILFLLAEKNFGLAGDRIETARKYRYRHLNDETTRRTSIFFKMLNKIPAGGYHAKQVELKAKKLKKQLDSLPIELAHQEIEVEIIPYEKLWQLILKTLI